MEFTAEQQAKYHDDRRPALYATLSVLLVLNNLAIVARLLTQWKTRYRTTRSILADDVFAVLSSIFANAIIANLFVATHYGLGLHSWRINAEDPAMPSNISNVFMHVGIVMVLTGPTLTVIKLTLLFFYRRMFLCHKTWLKTAWWANMVYIMLWAVGSTGFYIFQCWPVQWYFLRYYQRYHAPLPDSVQGGGQCNATIVSNVAMPLIFSLISDVAILLLPIATILKLQVTSRKKFGLTAVFSVGLLACALELARIIELEIDTDDVQDPSYGVVIFLILSVAEEVCAIICACLPVFAPFFLREYRTRYHSSNSSGPSKKLTLASGLPKLTTLRLGGDAMDSRAAHALKSDEESDYSLRHLAPAHVVESTQGLGHDFEGDGCIHVDTEFGFTVHDERSKQLPPIPPRSGLRGEL